MRKELNALECLEALEQDIKDRTILAEDRQLKLCAVIKQALLELKSIKEANPSEALECLEEIGFAPLNECCGYPYTRISDEYYEDFNTIQQALLKAEKEHKALEIIKEKNVDVFRFKKLDFDTFNQLQKSCKLPELTQEQFNLLKEMLK